RFIFVEKEEGDLVLRRGFKISPGEKLVIVEDVVTKGGRVAETIAIAREHQAEVCAVGVVVDRSNGTVDVGASMECLLPMEVETFAPDNLPEDLQAIPAIKPGS
ncbi:MAG: orotate phosphoribosyltransferase, partial [Verrucomicrobiales bacterium]|nr:orotate phosphoribosyltransferase [Verrucomicrobiales bacterium]